MKFQFLQNPSIFKKKKNLGRVKIVIFVTIFRVEIAAIAQASSNLRPARSWGVAVLLTESHGARSIGRTRSSKVAWSRGARSLIYHRVGG
jgi:hypothetical protein